MLDVQTTTLSGPAALREAEFWDREAARYSDSELGEARVGSSPGDVCRLQMLGDVRGKRVLDAGCGTGLWACHLAALGAEVWAIDISPQSIAVTRRRAEAQGVADRVHAAVMSVTATTFADSSFDVVHGQDIIHHVDAEEFAREMSRLLVDSGSAVFSENSANNPLLMLARNTLCGRFGIPKWSSDDEYPLTRAKRRRFASHFQCTTVNYPEFLFLHYLDAKLFGYRRPLVTRICRRVDRGVHRWLPFLRPYSYRQLLRFDSPLRTGAASR